MRDLRAALAGTKCWDLQTQALYEQHGEALEDCALQNREELLGLCEFIRARGIRSYLEIGVWTGRTVQALHRIFDFDKVAVCDHGWARQRGLPMHVPAAADWLQADSDSPEFLRWREGLGQVDLVLIDANHRYHAVKRDFEINRRFPHRFLALHDITGFHPATRGVARLWRELEGEKLEIVRPHRELGVEDSTMGIGIWSAGA